MATDLDTRPASSKSEAYLRQKFAELCARIKRVDLFAHLLALTLVIASYACAVGLFDWFVENSDADIVHATRWIAYVTLLGVLGYLLVQTARCMFRRVNPYFVAHQLERTLPDSKNILINWLDLHDETMPSAFQKTLSVRAAEQLSESDTEQAVPKGKNRIVMGLHLLPVLGLLVLLCLGPSAFLASMLRAFYPFYTPAPIPRTEITLVQPEAGNAEVGPTESIAFVTRIDGRVPARGQPDAPTLLYRYQINEDLLTQPLQQDPAGNWTAQLNAAQVRTGFVYKIRAGDDQTPEYQVRVRTRAHVKKYEIAYQHRPYRGLPKSSIVFPNSTATRPEIHGPPGSDVELVIRASRPVRAARVEIMAKNEKRDVPTRMLAGDAFACNWTLDQPGQFRVSFTTHDGEENADRGWHEVLVREDDAPTVILTQPGQDVFLAVNDTLVLDGRASSNVGIQSMTLHLRLLGSAPIHLSKPYRPGKSFRRDDGSYPAALDYQDFIALDQLKNDKGTLLLQTAGKVIEYWLEATDCTDVPNAAGNLGKSPVYKVTLTPARSTQQQEKKRKDAQSRQEKHAARQDNSLSKQNDDRKNNQPQDPQQELDDLKKDKKDAEDKIKQARDDKQKQDQAGGAKGSEPKSGDAKAEPTPSPDGPEPQSKDQPPMAPGEAGDKKDQGEGQGSSGESKDGGEGKKSPGDNASKGDRKDGPTEPPGGAKNGGPMVKDEPAGGAKDGGPTGMDSPMPTPAKEPMNGEGTPMPTAKNSKAEPQPQGNAKGAEQNGPEVPNKSAMNPPTPPDAKSKAGMMTDPAVGQGESKQGPAEQANEPGTARADDAKEKSKEPSFGEIAQLIEQLPSGDAKAEEAKKALEEVSKNADDPRKRDIAKEALERNGRDQKADKEGKKMPNPFGSGGQSAGISDNIKTAAANREFLARIGQMQLDDWKKQMTPDLLKKAGMTDADWQRYLKSAQSYNALVRQLNAKLVQNALKNELRAKSNPGAGVRVVENPGPSSDSLDTNNAPPPPDLRGPLRRLKALEKN